MKPSQRILLAATALLLIGASTWRWLSDAEKAGQVTATADMAAAVARRSQFPLGRSTMPLAANATPPVVASSILRDRFQDCPVLVQEQQERHEHGTVKVRRMRLVTKADFKYPMVRVVDELVREPAGDRLTKQTAMVGDHVVVKVLDAQMPESALLAKLQENGATLRKKMPGTGIWLIAFANPGLETVPLAITQLNTLNQWVRYAEPDYLVEATVTPNDASFTTQWSLRNTGQSSGQMHADIQATDAWSLSTGSPSVTVGIIDSGMDLTHPDLSENLWTNPHEIPEDGIDNDLNGFIDDVHGWDFLNNDNHPYDDYDRGHGTHCAGIIGAAGNNAAGIAGVCWRVSLMPLKFLNTSGNGTSSDATAAVAYATRAGVALTSNSYSFIGEAFSQSMKDAIDEADAAGILFVTATGNQHEYLDSSPAFPASYTSANLISVAATTRRDEMASYSNYGVISADLAAPGTEIYSTLPNGLYGVLSGTSMAAPHVAGACALLKAFKPGLTHSEIKNLILSSVDLIPSLATKTLTGGRLNVYNALIAADDILVSRGSDFSAAGVIGGPYSPASKTYTLTNHQSIPAAWTATVNRFWMSPTPAGGTLSAGDSVTVTLAFNESAATMMAGDHDGTLTFTSTATGRTYKRNLAVTVSPPPLYTHNLDSDPGWSRTGSWAFGVPTGRGGTLAGRPDPVSGATGSNVFGINLNGNYSTAIGPAEYLTAGPFDLSSHHSTQLRFQRWLNSDYQPWVYAAIEASSDGVLWRPVWDNGIIAAETDSHWKTVTYPLPPEVNGQSQVYIRWRHQVIGADPIPLSGWNVDDIEILGIPDRQIQLTLPASITEGSSSAGSAKILMVPALSTDVVINLSSNRPGLEASFPAWVTIPAGSEEATFELTPIDDLIVDGTQAIQITASATGFPSHTATLLIHDNESGALSLSLPTHITEGEGTVTGMAQVRLLSPAAKDILINLSSSDDSELHIPLTATILAGQTAADIPLSVQDDFLIDGPQTVTLTASVINWPPATHSLQVLDNESRQLSVILPSARLEDSGSVINGGTVSTAAPVETSLTISLSSDDATELTVPLEVIIPAGAASANFDLTFQDDDLSDGPQVVYVQASATTFLPGSATVIVSDRNSPAQPADPTPAHGLTNTHPESDLAWQTDPHSGGIPESYDLYFGTSNPPGPGEFIANTSSQQRPLPRLTPGTTYYWQIIACRGSSTRAGPVWSFTVPPVGAVKRFIWDPLPSSAMVDSPIPVRIGAVDQYDNPVISFAGRASLSAFVQIPETTTGLDTQINSSLLGTFYQKARSQIIYDPTEVGPAGVLTELGINVIGMPGQAINNLTIRLKHTLRNSYASNQIWEGSGWTTVYQGNVTLSSTGWTWFTFEPSFTYDGTRNLMVDISFSNPTFSTDGRCTASQAPSGFRSLSYRTDINDYGPPTTWNGSSPVGSISTLVPNLRFKREDVPVAMSPAITGLFTAGIWDGNIILSEGAPHAQIKAELASDPSVSGTSDALESIVLNGFTFNSEPAFTGGLTNEVTWQFQGETVDYEIQCSTTADFGTVTSTDFIAGSAHTFTGLNDGITYYYRGRARADDVIGDWSHVIHSTQDASPPTLTISPVSGGVIAQSSLHLSGTAADAGSGIASLTVDGSAATSGNTFATWNKMLFNLPSGPKTFTVVATDHAVPPNTRTESWAITRLINAGTDSDHNGVKTLLEYAFNTSGPNARHALPRIASAISAETGGIVFTVTYLRRLNRAGLNYILETSTDLTHWSDTAVATEVISTTPTGDSVTEAVCVRVPTPSKDGQLFVRIRVTIP